MNDFNFIDDELKALEDNNLRRELKVVLSACGPWVELSSGKRVLQFGSNNYLGLSNHPDISNAFKTYVSKYGGGSTGSRLLSGTTELHVQLEKALADFEGSEDALFFSSGYAANVGVLSAIIGKDDVVYSDELNHASIIDGIRLSGAHKIIYNHLDVNYLEELVQKNSSKFKRSFIVTDTVFSMDGDLAPLKGIGLIAEKYNCITIVDEAHGTGVFGDGGAGVVSSLKLENYFPIRVGTCSKAFGVEGGFCSAPRNVIEFLKNKSRSFMFSTSPSPGVVGAVLKSLDLIKDGNWRREKLWHNAKLLHSGLKKNYKLKVNDLKSPIINITFKNIEECLTFADKLFNECHVWAPAIRPPTVKEPRIRFTPISTHNDDDISYVIKAVEHLSKDLKLEPLFVNTES